MADKFSYVDSSGQKYEAKDTPANRLAVVKQGYKVDESILRTVGEVARGAEAAYPDWTMAIPTTWVPRLLLKGVGAATGAPADEDLPKYKGPEPGKLVYLDSEGAQHEAKDTPGNRSKLTEQGYKIPTAEELRVINDPAYSGVRGAVKTYVANTQNEYLFGLPAMAADRGLLPEGTFSPALQDKNLRLALEKENPTAEKLGMVAGTVANLLTPGLNLGGEAGLAAKAGARATNVAARLGVTGESALGRVVLGAAEHAGRGAAYATPRAAGALVINEDPKAAGEILLAGVGIGALLGGGGQVGKMAAIRGSQAATSAAEKFVERAGGVEAANAKVREAVVDTVADKIVGTGLKMTGVVKGGPVGYVAGEAANRVIGPVVKRGLERAYDDPRVQKMITTLASSIGRGIQTLPEVLPKIGAEAAGPVESTSINAVGRLLGKSDDPKTSPQERYAKAAGEISKLATDPQHLSTRIGVLTAGLEGMDPRAVQSFSTQMTNAVDYIFSTLPRTPGTDTSQPFAPKLPWEADSAEMAKLNRRLDAAIDPIGTVRKELLRGTLTKEHVEALDKLYPKLTEEMRSQILQKATQKDAPELTRAQRMQLAVFLGGNLERSTEPAKVQAYQGVYAQRAEGGTNPQAPARGSRLGRLESQKLPTVMTTAQAMAQRNSRT